MSDHRELGRSVRRAALLTLAIVAAPSCGPLNIRPVEYNLPQVSLTPLGATAASDATQQFAAIFCALLANSTGHWGPCGDYIDVPLQTPSYTVNPIKTELHVLLVGGVFSQCFEKDPDYPLETFQDTKLHFKKNLNIETDYVPVHPNGSAEMNAEAIRKWLADHPTGKFVAFGHSKGGIDLMRAFATPGFPVDRFHALVTVASPLAGSRLGDQVPNWVRPLPDQMTENQRCLSTLPWGAGAVASLDRKNRVEFLVQHPKIGADPVPIFSIAAVVKMVKSVDGSKDRPKVSRVLEGIWKQLTAFSLDQDSQVIADDAAVPGGTFLARAYGDHWAVAFPFELVSSDFSKKWVTENHYPRTVLHEAALRYVLGQ
jgi:hypothetical protein